MAEDMTPRVHLSNGRGGPWCKTIRIGVPISELDSEVTCSGCRAHLDRKKPTPGQIMRHARMNGKKTAKIPQSNDGAFARIFCRPEVTVKRY